MALIIMKQKNILKGCKVYLCGPLQYENWDKAISWRDSTKLVLKDLGILPLSPLDKVFKNFEKEELNLHVKLNECLKNGDLQTVHTRMKQIRRRDLGLIDFSNFVICVFNPGVATVGTIEELSLSQRSNKPVFIACPKDKISLWLLAMFPPSCFFNSLGDIIDHLYEINSGKIEISQEHWRIFENDYV